MYSALINFCLFFNHPFLIHKFCDFSINYRMIKTIFPQFVNLKANKKLPLVEFCQ